MLFTDIRLQNYRSYKEASFELGPGVNIVVGPNAVGKTNLLEALMVIAVGKSYKAKDASLIKNGEQWLRLDVHTSDNHTRIVKIKNDELGRPQKSFEIDNKTFKRLGPSNKQPVVLFQPEDLRLLHADPMQRREYIDDLIEQFTPGYGKLRQDLKRVLAQRNALLKSDKFDNSQLFAWDVRLSEVADKLVAERIKIVSVIESQISNYYQEISSKNTKLRLEYQSKIRTENYAANLLKELEANQSIDRIRGFTGRGPHRDDIVAYFSDTPMAEVASRGENRTFILALKIIELRILEDETGKLPLLLLDDVFSELDGARRRSLTTFLSKYQTIITTTDADIVSQNFINKALTIALSKENLS